MRSGLAPLGVSAWRSCSSLWKDRSGQLTGDDDDDGDDDGDDFLSILTMGLGLAIMVLFVGSVRSVGIILNCVCYI